jgi:hypothetical protein
MQALDILLLWPVWLVPFLGCLFRLLYWPRLEDGTIPAPRLRRALIALTAAFGLATLAGFVYWLFWT